jgi:L-lactate dehydrogenase complex protein LldG
VSDARAAILARIRARRRARRRAGPVTPPGARPPLPAVGTDLAGAFAERARRLASDVVGPLDAAQAPAAVADYLRRHALPAQAVCWPELAALDWAGAGLAVAARAARADDLVGISGAFCAIAETGTLMLLSGPQTPATVSLLPETHVALLPVTQVVARMEDAWARLRAAHGRLPRAVNFVSGPSRTADIEQTVTLGAHGPYRVLIVLTL